MLQLIQFKKLKLQLMNQHLELLVIQQKEIHILDNQLIIQWFIF
jgi:hypothetical protein